ncbi:MAG: class I SAM-dependent methyltransferase [Oscillospiraceae bacterium]|nr:class I SAM-dependent methyltransferase [Oscillospiraceae bacterium]
MERKYYNAYDDRYRQVHREKLKWFDDKPSPVVGEIISKFGISEKDRILEIGCGEGRDAAFLLDKGYDLLATDVSPEAIGFCRSTFQKHQEKFRILDCVTGALDDRFDFIYAVAVLHMLVPDGDRDRFYTFIRRHLQQTGIALICTMGDGSTERQTDIRTAFDLQQRLHEGTGKMLEIANTSCRMVSFETFIDELKRNRLSVLAQGISDSVPGFHKMMYAVVRRQETM